MRYRGKDGGSLKYGISDETPVTGQRLAFDGTGYAPFTAPNCTLTSAITQGVVSAAVAYPLLFESSDVMVNLYRQAKTFTVDNSGGANCTITCSSNHLLTAGAAVVFSSLVGGTGITAGTVYYVSATNLTASTFELSATFLAASSIKTSATGSGTVTCVSRIYVATSGNYLFIVSGLCNTSDNSSATMDLWFVRGTTVDTAGTTIPRSDTQAAIDSNGQQQVVTVPFSLEMAVGDFIRLDYRGSSTKIQWLSLAAVSAGGGTPAIPLMPSVILTGNFMGV